MTPIERAAAVVKNFVPFHLTMAINIVDLTEAIRVAIVENCNDEVSRRREAERALEGCNLGTVILVCDEQRTYLKAYNRHRKRWSVLSMIEEGSGELSNIGQERVRNAEG